MKNLAGCGWVWRNLAGCEFQRASKDFKGFTKSPFYGEFGQVFQVLAGCGWVWLGVDGCGRVWLGVDGCGQVWLGVGRCGWVWLGALFRTALRLQ